MIITQKKATFTNIYRAVKQNGNVVYTAYQTINKEKRTSICESNITDKTLVFYDISTNARIEINLSNKENITAKSTEFSDFKCELIEKDGNTRLQVIAYKTETLEAETLF